MISDFATLNNSPELTFYLDVGVDTSVSRREYMEDDRIEKKGIQYLNKVRQGFLSIAWWWNGIVPTGAKRGFEQK